jgi:hypothetical protein
MSAQREVRVRVRSQFAAQYPFRSSQDDALIRLERGVAAKNAKVGQGQQKDQQCNGAFRAHMACQSWGPASGSNLNNIGPAVRSGEHSLSRHHAL